MRHRLAYAGWLLLLLNLTFPLFAQTSVKSNQKLPGYPDRSENLDVLPGFIQPPVGYGEVSFYWWLGDTLTKERMLWQLDQLAGHSISGLQINYAHSDEGGNIWGLTYPGQPKLFSKDWWNLFTWFLQEAKKRNMSVSLSDYTLGIAGQGYYVDEMLKENPKLHGSNLASIIYQLHPGEDTVIQIPENLISAKKFRSNGDQMVTQDAKDITNQVTAHQLHLNAIDEPCTLVLVYAKAVLTSFDPMNPLSGAKVIEKFFQPFENHCPGEAGKALNFFFSDELNFGIEGLLWNDQFFSEFKKRKGYDIVPEIAGLFVDIGPRTPKIRLDYNDVQVALSEENFFIPLYQWHSDRGMLFGCDHGGRGLKVDEYGDYFRTVRWMSGPGCDQPTLSRNIAKNKVASSISHLYERPRTWLEGYHSSGWGTSSAQLAEATFTNFAMGQNLLSLHGLYYSTHGGWWEWAPPDNHFRQPYWADMNDFLKCTERLSYILSQGYHRCDVAILYPLAPTITGMGGKTSVETAFSAGETLYSSGIDFDYIDFESLKRAKIKNGELQVSGESYKVLILPAMTAIRFSTLEKSRDFYNSGGVVIAVGALPLASDRVGGNDPLISEINNQVFGLSANNIQKVDQHTNETSHGKGIGMYLRQSTQIPDEIKRILTLDFKVFAQSVKPYVLHRKAGTRDIYFVYGVPKDTICSFRSTGSVELWNPWDGSTKTIPVIYSGKSSTRLPMPLSETEPQLIVFSPGEAKVLEENTVSQIKKEILLVGDWEFELKPTLNNVWGDYRQPAYAGFVATDANQIRYKREGPGQPQWQKPALDDSSWDTIQITYGPYFWRLGPLPGQVDSLLLESQLSALQSIHPDEPVRVGEKTYYWKPYEFSWRWGLHGNAGRQGYHGLKEWIHDDIFQLGTAHRSWTGAPKPQIIPEKEGSTYYFWSSVNSDMDQQASLNAGGIAPSGLWINGHQLDTHAHNVNLQKGHNGILLRFSTPGTGYLVLEKQPEPSKYKQNIPLASGWYLNPAILPYDLYADNQLAVGWYRFSAPPGLQSVELAVNQKPQVWVDGIEIPVQPYIPPLGLYANPSQKGWKAELPRVIAGSSIVAVRLKMEMGNYGGAAIAEPIRLNCGKGTIRLGNLQNDKSLMTYSGGMCYSKTISLSADQIRSSQIFIDLGDLVASAEVFVNGKLIGKRLTPPWKFNLTGQVSPGDNRIEVLIYNTLGNYYQTTPSSYIGNTRSGLIGPVKLLFE